MDYKNKNLFLSSPKYDYRNTIKEGITTYKIEHLTKEQKKSKGGNSSVFKLIDPNTDAEFAIKFLKFPANSSSAFYIKQNLRFDNEIKALEKARDKEFMNVIEIHFDGQKKIGDNYFRYYVMEKAESDLKVFLEKESIPVNQKLVLGHDIVKGILQLHSMDLYHRDIKPDNLFFVVKNDKATWKVGDLGLSVWRDQDLSQVEVKEKIGPYGWLSPEVTNKVLCEGSALDGVFDCKIDGKSDIFQLGKVLWFLFQGNIPVGQIRFTDFIPRHKEIFALIKNMLQYKKSRRNELSYYVDQLHALIS